jgi:hypothetical protein
MAGQDHLDVLLLMKHVENLKHNAPRQREKRLHAFTFEAFDKDFSACQFHTEPPLLLRDDTRMETPIPLRLSVVTLTIQKYLKNQ